MILSVILSNRKMMGQAIRRRRAIHKIGFLGRVSTKNVSCYVLKIKKLSRVHLHSQTHFTIRLSKNSLFFLKIAN